MPSLADLVIRTKYSFRLFAGRRPWLLFNVYRHLKRHRDLLVRSDTQLVLEGYPRSSNSFALRAFQQANPGVSVAHHMHAQAQVIVGVGRRIPTLVVTRRPDEAVRSMLVRYPQLTIRQALTGYVQFHEDIEPHSGQIVLARFEEVTEDFGAVTQRINQKFGTTFARFTHSDATTALIFAQMDQANVAAFGKLKATHVPRPHQERVQMKRQIALESEPELLGRAWATYRRLTGT